MVSLRVSGAAELSSDPVSLTVPREPSRAPIESVVKVPPRLTVPPMAVTEPRLFQLPPRERVAPAGTETFVSMAKEPARARAESGATEALPRLPTSPETLSVSPLAAEREP